MNLRLRGRRRTAALLGALGLVAVGGTGAALASDDSDANERQIEGSDLERASEVALAETGGGTVTATELEDEESRFEVEVTLPDGSQVDVQLDADFQVVGSEADDDDAGD